MVLRGNGDDSPYASYKGRVPAWTSHELVREHVNPVGQAVHAARIDHSTNGRRGKQGAKTTGPSYRRQLSNKNANLSALLDEERD